MNAVDLAVDALATHRLTRLATRDRITRRPRAEIIIRSYAEFDREQGNRRHAWTDADWEELARTDETAPAGAAFIVCAWCTSIWIGAAVVAARRYAPGVWDPLARALASSTVVGLIAEQQPG